MEGVIVYYHPPECRVTFGRGDSMLFDTISVPTIELSLRPFQTFINISLHEKVIRKSRRSQNKIFIRGASPGIPDELWDKNPIGGRRWDVYTKEQRISDMEIETVTLVVKGSAKFTVSTDWRE